MTLAAALDAYTKRVIIDALTANRWNKGDTARSLDIDRATLYRLMRKLGVAMNGADFNSGAENDNC